MTTLPRETLIFTIARLLEGVRHVAVGASSPIPAAGAMLCRALAEPERHVRISILGSAPEERIFRMVPVMVRFSEASRWASARPPFPFPT